MKQGGIQRTECEAKTKLVEIRRQMVLSISTSAHPTHYHLQALLRSLSWTSLSRFSVGTLLVNSFL